MYRECIFFTTQQSIKGAPCMFLRKRSIPLLIAFFFLIATVAGYAAPQGSFGSATRSTGTELEGKIFYLPENTESLPDFSKLKSVGSIYTNAIDIGPRTFEEGFPGVTERFEWFGIVYTGNFGITSPGSYRFKLISDDGSKLWIDGKQLLTNDGVHPPNDVEASISLGAGNHTIRVEYFQGPRYELALQLFISPPNGDETIFSITQYPPK